MSGEGDVPSNERTMLSPSSLTAPPALRGYGVLSPSDAIDVFLDISFEKQFST